MIGFLIITLVVVPVAAVILAFILDKPRKSRVPGVFLGSVVVLLGGMIVLMALLGTALSFIVG